jgi:pimeloyl-ACP methyl ester carboxylesterase
MFEHRPYLVFADALTRRGVAVLRMDDRGVGGSSAGPPGATTSDFAGDVEAALAWLRTRQDIDPGRIGLLGHSEGGAIASLVASRDPAVGYVVLLAGAGVSGREIVVDQVRAIAVANGASAEQAQQAASLQWAILDAVMAAPEADGLRAALDAITARHGAPRLSDMAIGQITSPWYRHFLALDPARSLRTVRAPVLALLGGKDVQVTPAQNAPALRAALAENAMASVEVMPGLNHLFQTARTGSPDEYGRIEETIAPAALTRVVDWIVDRAAVIR